VRHIRQRRVSEAEKQEGSAMKKMLWMVGGLCAAAAGFLVWGTRRSEPVEELAHRLEDAWSDHHTEV
jgi:hypothetical protein